MNLVEIKLHNRNLNSKSTLEVEKLSENSFRMIDNDLIDSRLTYGVEFEVIFNKDKKYEVSKILKESNFITKRYSLTSNHTESDYRMLGEELIKRGGFWQVDFGSIATVNISKDFKYDVEQVINDLELKLIEITED